MVDIDFYAKLPGPTIPKDVVTCPPLFSTCHNTSVMVMSVGDGITSVYCTDGLTGLCDSFNGRGKI